MTWNDLNWIELTKNLLRTSLISKSRLFLSTVSLLFHSLLLTRFNVLIHHSIRWFVYWLLSTWSNVMLPDALLRHESQKFWGFRFQTKYFFNLIVFRAVLLFTAWHFFCLPTQPTPQWKYGVTAGFDVTFLNLVYLCV